MILNDYECRDCALVFDAKVPADGADQTCPYCGGSNVSWRPACINIRFDGSGWTGKFFGKDKEDNETPSTE